MLIRARKSFASRFVAAVVSGCLVFTAIEPSAYAQTPVTNADAPLLNQSGTIAVDQSPVLFLTLTGQTARDSGFLRIWSRTGRLPRRAASSGAAGRGAGVRAGRHDPARGFRAPAGVPSRAHVRQAEAADVRGRARDQGASTADVEAARGQLDDVAQRSSQASRNKDAARAREDADFTVQRRREGDGPDALVRVQADETDSPAMRGRPSGPSSARLASAESGAGGVSTAGGNGGAPPPPSDGGGDDGAESGKYTPVLIAAIAFIAIDLISQAGVETFGSTWPKFLEVFSTKHYGHDYYPTFASLNTLVRLIGAFTAGWIGDRLGARRSFLGGTLLMAAMGAALVLLLKTSAVGLVPLFALGLGLYYLQSAVLGVIQETLPVVIFRKSKEGTLKFFNTVNHFMLEFVGIGIPYKIKPIIAALTMLGTLGVQPVTLVLCFLIALFFMRVAEQKEQASGASGGGAERERDPALLQISRWGYPAALMVNFLLYSIVAITYGTYVHPGNSLDEQTDAASVAGKLTSLYSAGGLGGAVLLMWDEIKSAFRAMMNWIMPADEPVKEASRASKAGSDDYHLKIKLLRSIVRWSIISAIAGMGFVALLFKDVSWAQAAMVPFGFSNVVLTVLLKTLLQENVPLDRKGLVLGVAKAFGYGAAAAGIYGFGLLRHHFLPLAGTLWNLIPLPAVPFLCLLGFLAVLGAYYVMLGAKLSRYIGKLQVKRLAQAKGSAG